ncbi:Tho complex subunit 7-domain-containing protein [Phellopilus nigrolimitatus]|nr:Tho complex subunit 7-domain-containing protein [Phellopilus nigrolimitatus]
MATKSTQAKDVPSISLLTVEEEDALIHTRITNDERPLRRLTKKFHTYGSVAYPPIVEPPPFTTSSVEEAREAFLIELASFELLLRKSRMVCDAERRQVDVYKKEKMRIANEHIVLKSEIEELKTTLEQAQLERRRKIEYDQVAEKINVLPSREELELSINALENDMQIIRDEHNSQNRSILARKSALDTIVTELGHLRLLGKDVPKAEGSGSRADSEDPLPAPMASGSGMDVDGAENANATEGEGEKESEGGLKDTVSLNVSAKSFTQQRQGTPLLQTATHQLRLRNSTSGLVDTPLASRDVTPAPTPVGGPDSSPLSPLRPSSPAEEQNRREDGEEDEEGEEGEEAEDIEMGEVSEKERGSGRGRNSKLVEDREEGEASDESSELSDPPDE